MTSPDKLLEALDLLMKAIAVSRQVDSRIIERIDHLRTERERGLPYAEIVPAEERPLIVEMLTENLQRLAIAGNRVRRAEAQALHDDGLMMDEIAALFGVTRQRIGALLRQAEE